MKVFCFNRLRGFWVSAALLVCACSARADVVVYPQPAPEIAPSADFAVHVIQCEQTQEAFVYEREAERKWESRHDGNSWTSFSHDGPVTVEVRRLAGGVESARIYPTSYGITPTIVDDQTIRFEVPRPNLKMAVIFNGDFKARPLLLFADPLETDIPAPGDPNVLYYAPGVHDVGIVKVATGQTVYLAGGAYLRGAFELEKNHDIVIRGRGILSGERFKHNECHMINGDDEEIGRITVEGITIIHAPFYCVRIHGYDNLVDNVKMMTWQYNGDGVENGVRGRVQDSFFKCNDDGVKLYFYGNTVERCVFWHLENGSPFQISWNMDWDAWQIRVTDCDVIRTEHQWDNNNLGVINANHSGKAHMKEYVFEDIRVENCDWRLFYIRLHDREQDPGPDKRGNISNFIIRDFTATDCNLQRPNVLQGLDPEHRVFDFTFENLKINGKYIHNAEEGNFQLDPATTDAIRFVVTNDAATTAAQGK
jgi:hypothetical protein